MSALMSYVPVSPIFSNVPTAKLGWGRSRTIAMRKARGGEACVVEEGAKRVGCSCCRKGKRSSRVKCNAMVRDDRRRDCGGGVAAGPVRSSMSHTLTASPRSRSSFLLSLKTPCRERRHLHLHLHSFAPPVVLTLYHSHTTKPKHSSDCLETQQPSWVRLASSSLYGARH